MAESWMDQFAVQPTGPRREPEAWADRFAVAPTAVQARRAAPYEAEGAPYGVRLAVGTARPQDRLATIRRYYPDAEETDDGNFVFTDPATRRRTLYNPKGLDLGDLPSVTRQAAEALGGTAGGFLGAPLGPAGALGGAGLGTAAGSKAVDLARTVAGQPQGPAVAEVGADFLQGAAGEAAGGILSAAGRGVARSLIRPGAQATVEAAQRAGVPLTGAQVGRGPYAAMEASAANVLPYSRPQRTQSALLDQAGAMIERARPQTAFDPANPAEAARQAGGALKSGATAAYKAFRDARGKLDQAFYGAMPSGVRLKMPGVMRVAQELREEVARSPGVQGEALAPALRVVERLEADLAANRGALPVDLLRKARTQIGEELETRATSELPGPSQQAIRRLYAALNGDLRAGAAAVSPRAAQVLDRQDRLVRAFRGEDLGREAVAGSLDSIMRARSDEAAFSAFNAGTGGLDRMRSLVRRMSPEEKRVVARATFERLSSTPQGNPRDPAGWATQWLAAPREVKRLLYDGVAEIGELDDLARVLRAQAEGAKYRNTSGTGYELQRADILGSLARAALALGGSGAAGVGDEALSAAAAGYGLSELIYHPAAIRRLVAAANAIGPPSPAVRLGGQAAATGYGRQGGSR